MSVLKKETKIWQKISAWGVHLFTASGAAWGLLAVIAIQDHQWRQAMFWMVIAIFVDGFDGWLARWADVKTYARGVDGALMDNILDYFNYVIVPGLFLYEAELLPQTFALTGIILIALTSAFQFTQTDAKTSDHYFKGFPSYWNVMALYMFVLGMNPWVNFLIVIALNILVFVPVKYVYPSRTTRWQRLTLILTFIWAAAGIVGLFQYPQTNPWIMWSTFIYIGYYVLISVFPWGDRTRQSQSVD